MTLPSSHIWLLSAPALLAGLLVWQATAPGIGVSADSVQYLAAAESFRAGHGLMVPYGQAHPVWMQQFPGLFPIVLAIGIPPRVLQCLLAMATVLLVAIGGWRESGSVRAGVLAGAVVAGWPHFVTTHGVVLSEPLFLTLLVGGWLALREGYRRLGMVLTGLGAAARFVGVGAIRGGWLGLAPLALSMAAARVMGGAATNRAFGYHPLGADGIAAVAVLAGFVLWGRRNLAASMAAGLLGVLVFSRLFVDAAIEFEPRHLLPILVLGVLAASRYAPWPVWAVALAAVWWLPRVPVGREHNHPRWAQSETLARVRALPAGTRILSHGADLVYYQTRRAAEWAPVRTGYFDGRARPDWCLALRERTPAALVFFDALEDRGSFAVRDQDVPECLSGAKRSRLADGVLYSAENVLGLERAREAR